MSYIGKHVTVYMIPGEVVNTLQGTCVRANEITIDIVQDGARLGEYEGVTIPWNVIRCIMYKAERPR